MSNGEFYDAISSYQILILKNIRSFNKTQNIWGEMFYPLQLFFIGDFKKIQTTRSISFL